MWVIVFFKSVQLTWISCPTIIDHQLNLYLELFHYCSVLLRFLKHVKEVLHNFVLRHNPQVSLNQKLCPAEWILTIHFQLLKRIISKPAIHLNHRCDLQKTVELIGGLVWNYYSLELRLKHSSQDNSSFGGKGFAMQRIGVEMLGFLSISLFGRHLALHCRWTRREWYKKYKTRLIGYAGISKLLW